MRLIKLTKRRVDGRSNFGESEGRAGLKAKIEQFLSRRVTIIAEFGKWRVWGKYGMKIG